MKTKTTITIIILNTNKIPTTIINNITTDSNTKVTQTTMISNKSKVPYFKIVESDLFEKYILFLQHSFFLQYAWLFYQ